jgi:hypothetical protein
VSDERGEVYISVTAIEEAHPTNDLLVHRWLNDPAPTTARSVVVVYGPQLSTGVQ